MLSLADDIVIFNFRGDFCVNASEILLHNIRKREGVIYCCLAQYNMLSNNLKLFEICVVFLVTQRVLVYDIHYDSTTQQST